MGILFSAHSPTPPESAPGFFFNLKLHDSSIKELRSLRTKTATALRAQGRNDAYVATTLAVLDDEIARRETGLDPIQ